LPLRHCLELSSKQSSSFLYIASNLNSLNNNKLSTRFCRLSGNFSDLFLPV
jgi:hypothetical protein